VGRIPTIPIVLLLLLVLVSSSISNYGYFGYAKVAYGQSNPGQMNSNATNSVNIQDIPVRKVHVGDIDIAYKVFGKGEPILLFNGASDGMNAWDPSLLKTLSSNHTVIVFDSRGIGNTTAGSKPVHFTIVSANQFNLAAIVHEVSLTVFCECDKY